MPNMFVVVVLSLGLLLIAILKEIMPVGRDLG
jgi:hypothetical protein